MTKPMEQAAGAHEALNDRIAELERANQALRRQLADRERQELEALAVLEGLLAGVPIGIGLFDRDYRYVRVNRFLAEINGLPIEEHLGRPIRQVVPVNAPLVEPVIDEVLRTGEPVRDLVITGETPAAPGETRHWLTGFYPVPVPGTGMPLVGVVVVEITEQKRIEQERERLFRILEVERSRLARVFMKAPAFIATLRGRDHVLELVNPTFEQLVGFRDILGRPVRQALPELEGQGFFELLDQVYGTGETFTGREMPIHLQREPGGPLDERCVDFVYLPLLDPSEAVSGIFVHGIDVTEQVRARQRLEELVEELQRAEEALREADRRKDEFLAMLGHELRNPLAPIRNAVFVMRQLGGGSPEIERARDMIDRQVSHLARLVDDLLDVSRISRGKILLRQETLDLVALTRTTAEDHRRDLEAAGLRFTVRLPEGPAWVKGDPTRLAQVLGNILHNAGKFTDAGGQVELGMVAEPEGAWAEITVRDTGIGMEPRMVERLFEAFSQADRSLDRSRGGLGLGLALVKGLVDLHGGQVYAASEGLGRGTVVSLRFPRQAAVEPAGRQTAEEPAAPGIHRILVIEDNVDAAESMQLLLELAGHQVTTAFDGPSGVEAAHRFGPGVVLCDIGLPGEMDGYAVARELRRDGARPAMLIALTGYGQEEDLRRSREAGFDLHLTKPVDPAALGKLLAELPVR